MEEDGDDGRSQKSTDIDAKFDEKVRISCAVAQNKFDEFLAWVLSPPDCRVYPENYKTNKNKYRDKIRDYSYDEKKGIIWKRINRKDGTEIQVEVILSMERQNKLIVNCHEGIGDSLEAKGMASHPGRDKMFDLLRTRYSFPMMRDRIMHYIRYCDTCQRASLARFPKAGQVLRPIKVKNEFWTQIGVDLIGPLEETCNKRYIVTAVCYFTKWVEAEAITDKSGDLVGDFLHRMTNRHGCAKVTITDQGKEFNNDVTKALFRLTGCEHRVSSAYHPQTNGLVERQNRTTEDCIRKNLENKKDWLNLLDSVLFACRTTKHASTGNTPYRLVYHKDPLLPFELKDKIDEYGENVYAENDVDFVDLSLEEKIELMEAQRKQIFEKNMKNIEKAQERYARNYNKRHAGVEFPPGTKVLKRNMKDANRMEKMKPRYLHGPYTVLYKCSKSSAYYLKDKYSHELKRPVPARQLCLYNERKRPLKTEKDPTEGTGVGVVDEIISAAGNFDENAKEIDSDINSAIDPGSPLRSSTPKLKKKVVSGINKLSKKRKYDDEISQRTLPFSRDNWVKRRKVMKSPIGGQFVIIGNEGELSSDASSVDAELTWKNPLVGSSSQRNPWPADMPVREIPIEYVDNLTQSLDSINSEESCGKWNQDPDDSVIVRRIQEKDAVLCFMPLDFNTRKKAAESFNIVITAEGNAIKYGGIGEPLNKAPLVMRIVAGDGGCYFSSLSVLLTGTAAYTTMIRFKICAFIRREENFHILKKYMNAKAKYSDGDDYLNRSKMLLATTWATQVEIVASAMITRCPVVVYTEYGKWIRFGERGDFETENNFGLYMDNRTGYHFNPVTHVV